MKLRFNNPRLQYCKRGLLKRTLSDYRIMYDPANICAPCRIINWISWRLAGRAEFGSCATGSFRKEIQTPLQTQYKQCFLSLVQTVPSPYRNLVNCSCPRIFQIDVICKGLQSVPYHCPNQKTAAANVVFYQELISLCPIKDECDSFSDKVKQEYTCLPTARPRVTSALRRPLSEASRELQKM